jgi:hypothetical protein
MCCRSPSKPSLRPSSPAKAGLDRASALET